MDRHPLQGATVLLRDRLGDAVRENESLAPYTTLRVGGPAALLVRVEAPADIEAVAGAAARFGLPSLVVGRGSNLLVADDGWPGIALVLGRGFRGVEIDGDHMTAGAAEPMPALARHAAAAGLSGLAFGVAIPGTLGGAVRMNAGAHGADLAGVLRWADVARLGAGGEVERWPVSRLQPGYRHTELPADGVVLRASMRLQAADHDRLTREMDEMRRWRREHQPINEPSCGSVFRNPPGDSAGRLIEAAGLKGRRVGGAQISTVHSNFITVTRGASARDVRDLIITAQAAVRDHSGVELQTEVVLAGWGTPVDAPARERR